MRKWKRPELQSFRDDGFMAPMHLRREQIVSPAERSTDEAGRHDSVRAGRISRRKIVSAEREDIVEQCDKASPARAVMLHLRACHVSKAAILTIPAHRVPVENRSPA